MTSRSFYKVNDNRKRECRKCHHEVVKGEFVKRTRVKNVALHRGPESIRSMWLCENCYTDAKGHPMVDKPLVDDTFGKSAGVEILHIGNPKEGVLD